MEYLYRPLVLAQCRRGIAPIGRGGRRPRCLQDSGDQDPSLPETDRGELSELAGRDHTQQDRRLHPAVSRSGGAAGGTDAQDALGQVPDQAPDAVAEADELSERRLLCRQALMLVSSEFQPRSWHAVWRVVVENQRPSDVAADLGMTENAVYIAKSRILCRLREVAVQLGESTYEAADMAPCPEGFQQ